MSVGPAQVKIKVDDTELRKAEREHARVMRAFATNIRRGAEVTIAFARAAGTTIDIVLDLFIRTALRSIEFVTALLAVESVATLGVTGALRFGAQAAAIALMFAQINAILSQQTESNQRLGFAVTAMMALTYMFLPIKFILVIFL
jgi:chromate transport protein ChrA